MADYLPLISRAVGTLPDNTPEARRVIYERARAALDLQLRALDPPLSEADIAKERLALDEAIARVENEKAVAAILTLPSLAQKRAEPEPRAAGEDDLFEPSQETATGADSTPEKDWPQDDERERPTAPTLPYASSRPRLDSVFPRHEDRGENKRRIIVGVVLAVVLAAIAGLAIALRDPRPQPGSLEPAPNTARQESSNERKFSERVGGEAPPTAAPGPAAPQASAQQQPPAAQPPAGQPAISVAQRAILYEETAENPQAPRAFAGRVVWRLETVDAGQGQPAETAIRADIEVAEAGMSLAFVIRRNTDATLPASHLIQMTFSRTGDAEGRTVRDVGVPQLKVDEQSRGTPLAGLPVPVTANVFLVGLSNLRTDMDRNLEFLRNRAWFDVPLRLANGQRAILAFEKGTTGERVVSEAFSIWQQ